MSRARTNGGFAPGSRQRGLADDYLNFTASRRCTSGAGASSEAFLPDCPGASRIGAFWER